MDTLTEHYRRYCENPTTRHRLWGAIVEFDDFDRFPDVAAECFEIGQRYTPDLPATHLSTNGSTGAPKSYQITDFDFWCPAVEGLLRGCTNLPSMFLFNRPFVSQPCLKLFGNTIHLSLDDERQCHELLKLLDRPVVLIATPNTWLHITTALADQFNNTAIVHGVNTDWEMFGKFEKLTFPVRDQMIDWFTGLNFYTCDAGFKHFLPLFHQAEGLCKNLLNLKQTLMPCEDRFVLKGTESCPCGKRRPEFEFISHQSNHLDVDRRFVLDHLDGGHINFQMVLDGDVLHVYDIPTGEPQSFDWLDAIVHQNQYFQIGAKAYNFWKMSPQSNHLVGTFTSAASLAGHSSLMFL